MEVKYNPPTKNEKGVFVFQEPTEQMGTDYSVRVSSLENYLEKQARILTVTGLVVDYLRRLELPAGVEGNAEVMFRLWSADKHIFGIGRIGDFGFPDFSIQTNYGHSNLHLWPKGKGGEVEVTGRGIAEEVVKAFQGEFEKAFGVPDSQLQSYGGHVDTGSLTARLILPKPRF